MEKYTLTFSESVQGWPSFYSYNPDMILGMNQYLYTFSDVRILSYFRDI